MRFTISSKQFLKDISLGVNKFFPKYIPILENFCFDQLPFVPFRGNFSLVLLLIFVAMFWKSSDMFNNFHKHIQVLPLLGIMQRPIVAIVPWLTPNWSQFLDRLIPQRFHIVAIIDKWLINHAPQELLWNVLQDIDLQVNSEMGLRIKRMGLFGAFFVYRYLGMG